MGRAPIYGSIEKKYYKPGRLLIGVDEVGKGCIAGPLTVAAVILPPELYIPGIKIVKKVYRNKDLWFYLKKEDSLLERVRDSKALQESPRIRASARIRAVAVSCAVTHRSNEFIDARGLSEAFISATNEVVRRALDSVEGTKDITSIICLLDGVQRMNIGRMRTMSFPKGDSLSWNIAAASIVAKTERDAMMIEYHSLIDDRYAFASNKGYGTADHLQAIGDHGICELHRRSVKTSIPGSGKVRLGTLESD